MRSVALLGLGLVGMAALCVPAPDARAASFKVGEALPSPDGQVVVQSVAACDGESTSRYAVEEFEAAALSCHARTQLSDSFEAATLVLQDAAAVTACTGVGAAATVYLEVGAAVTGTVGFVVKHLSCEDSDSDKVLEAKIKTAVCDALAKKGISSCE